MHKDNLSVLHYNKRRFPSAHMQPQLLVTSHFTGGFCKKRNGNKKINVPFGSFKTCSTKWVFTKHFSTTRHIFSLFNSQFNIEPIHILTVIKAGNHWQHFNSIIQVTKWLQLWTLQRALLQLFHRCTKHTHARNLSALSDVSAFSND